MYIARILYPVKVLGPGLRIGLWLSGCARKCKGCSNPELWTQKKEQEISVSRLSDLCHLLAREHPVDGVTITGGEPMDQAGELSLLLPLLSGLTDDILIYTGYTLEALQARNDPATDAVLRCAAALIDGEYREEMNDGSPLRGSSNQRIHIFSEAHLEKYQAYLKNENQIQNFSLGGSIVSAGIHRPGYESGLREGARKKGLIENG